MTRVEMENFLVAGVQKYFNGRGLMSKYSISGMIGVFAFILSKAGYKYSFEYGAEKLVVIIDDFDYVVKIPMIDTSCREYEIYQEAKKIGLEEFFAPTYKPFAAQVGHHTLWMYCQKKIHIVNDMMNNTMDIEDSFNDEEICIKALCREVSNEWAMNSGGEPLLKDHRLFIIIPLLGMTRAQVLLDFLMEHRINDLWSANYSFSMENGLIFFDFAGYESNEEIAYFDYEEEEEELDIDYMEEYA